MWIELNNGQLSLTVDTLGAQMLHLRAGGTEYLWQGDPKYWADRAPVLFPFIGRLTGDSYCWQGKTYPMGIHGFAAAAEFVPTARGADHVVLTLAANEATRESYPFAFTLEIAYRLAGSRLEITYTVRNEGGSMLPFGIGGHPGFRVPFAAGTEFADYYLEFSDPCRPDRVGFTPAVYLSGHDTAYPLENGRIIRLRHDLFDDDAIILKNMCREITLKTDKDPHFVQVIYPQMAYLGIWHWPHTDAPYVCIEPWTSLPSRQDVVEDFACKSDLVHLLPGKTYENTWTITLGRE